MAFLETPRFPVDIKYGSMGGPVNSTDIVVTGGGVEYRNSNWSEALNRYNAKYSIKLRSSVLAVYELFLASKGRFGGFRYKDFFDFTSSSNGVDSPATSDQTIGVGDGVEVDFQLIKTYTTGIGIQVRNIRKPVVSAGVIIEVDIAGVLTEGVDYTIDYTTGIVTFTSAPLNTRAIRAGYEFDVPVRFDTDDLSDLFFTLISTTSSDTDIVNLSDIPLMEIRT